MKFNENMLGIAAGCSMAIWYTICAIFVKILPDRALQLTASLFHLTTLAQFAPYLQLSFVNFLSGLIQCFIYTYLYVLVFAWIYNQLVKEK